MVTIPAKFITLEEFLALPETKPVSEYIDGKIFQKPIPKGKHSTIQTELSTAINNVLKPTKTARASCSIASTRGTRATAFRAFSELRCTFAGRSTVPDVAVFTWDRIPRDDDGSIANTFEIAPDWTIEILSPDQSHTRVTRNILYCLDNGTQLGWLIDPSEQSIFAYYPSRQLAFFEDTNDVLPVPDFANLFQLTLGELFSWLLE